MSEPLTRGESQSMFDEIKKEITRINNLIKEKKVGGATIELLDEKKTLLQKQLDNLLKKGGVITEDDFNESYNLIRAKEEKELLDLKSKQSRRLITWGIIGVALVVTYIVLLKKK